jgi:hypothetical protein
MEEFKMAKGRKPKYTIKDIKSMIEHIGYTYISGEYKNIYSDITIQCDNGHIYTTEARVFLKGSRCPECAKINRKFSYEFIKTEIEKTGYKLLSTNYINSGEYLEVECLNGHIYNTSWDNFKQGHRCMSCVNKEITDTLRFTYEEVKNYLEQEGYTLISQEYHNSNEDLEMVCINGHTLITTYNRFKNCNVRCRLCQNKLPNKGRTIRRREAVIEIVKINGYEIINESFEYKNVYSRFLVRCIKGHEFETCFENLRKSNFSCQECYYDTKRTDVNIVFEEFLKYGLIPLFSSKYYRNNSQELPYLCSKHIEKGVQYTCYSNILRTQFGCIACSGEQNRGENHVNWKGGISTLTDFMRRTITEWKKESMRKDNYKCVLSNKPFSVIHHLYSYNKIIQEVLNELHLDVRTTMSEYSLNEKTLLVNKCLELHYKYGLGVCLCEELHKLFHNIYGVLDNSHQQFEEFKIRLKLGDFNRFLEDNNLKIII